MRTHTVVYQSSPSTQIVRASGRGYIALLTISHSASAAEIVSFYDSADNLLARYEVSPSASPFTIAFPARRPFWFSNGLKVNTGDCVVNMTVVY